MQLWQYLLAADKKKDLGDPAAGWAWMGRQPWGIFAGASRWTDQAQANWRPNLLALRGIARRLARKRPRRQTVEQVEECGREDRVAYRYIRLMHPCVRFRDGGPSVLYRDTYLGFRLAPTYAAPPELRHFGDRLSVEVTPGGAGQEFYWLDDWTVFWEEVFFGLVAEAGPVVCEVCGRDLGVTTATGRPKKQQVCGKCRYRAWYKRQPKTKLRAKWREDYANRNYNKQRKGK
jgi:hypothetical protein